MTALKSMREALLSVADILDLSPTSSSLGAGTTNTATNSFLSSLAAAAAAANNNLDQHLHNTSGDQSQGAATNSNDKFPASLAHLTHSQSAHPFLQQHALRAGSQQRGALVGLGSFGAGDGKLHNNGNNNKDCLSNNPDSPLSASSSIRGDDIEADRMDDDVDDDRSRSPDEHQQIDSKATNLGQQQGGYSSIMSPASSSSSSSSTSSLTASSSPSHLLNSGNNNNANNNNNGAQLIINSNSNDHNPLFAQSSAVYEMAALTADLDTPTITTRIKETLMAHNLGQKIFGEVVLGLSQGSVSELLSKPKPWHMLSIKGREPFIRMHLWLNDKSNIDKLQSLKNERREAKRIKR